MRLDELRELTRKELDKSSVYRTDAFIDRAINNGYRLIGVLSLFDERRGSVTITGGRNYIPSPDNLGPELLTNTNFSADTSWTKAGAEWTISGGSATCDGSQSGTWTYIRQTPDLDRNCNYQITWHITVRAGGIYAYLGAGGTGTEESGELRTTTGTYTENLLYTSSRYFDIYLQGNSSFEGDIELVSLKKVLDSSNCIVPLYMANTDTGTRVHPVSIDEMEFYSSTWEGRTATDSQYYTVLSPFSSEFNEIVVCPYQTTTEMHYSYVGAYESTELSSDSDEPRLPEEYQDLLITYAKFESFIGEPGMVGQTEIEVKRFISRMNEFIASIKSRFPSGRDYEPYSAEFNYSTITEQQMKPQEVETKNAR